MKILSFVLTLCAMVSSVHAQEGAPAEAAATAPGTGAIAFKGFVSAAGVHNFTYPGLRTDDSGVRAFDHQYGTLSLDVAQLSAQLVPLAGQAGFRIDLNAGYSIPRRTGSEGSASSSGATDFDLLQAFGSYVFDIGRGLRLDAGKFVTHMGAEIIEGVDGMNFNYSRSMSFYNTIPFTHTGLRLSLPLTDMLSAMVMVTNGADVVLDNNDNKGIGAQVGITPAENMAFYVNYFVSANQPMDNHDLRHYVDLVATVKLIEKLTLNLNFDWTKEDETDIPGVEGKTQMGVSAIVAYTFTDLVSLAVRGEFWDTGLDTSGDGDNETFMGVTLTPTFTLGSNFAIRPELRYDMASEDLIWVSGDPGAEVKSSQMTAALNIVAWY